MDQAMHWNFAGKGKTRVKFGVARRRTGHSLPACRAVRGLPQIRNSLAQLGRGVQHDAQQVETCLATELAEEGKFDNKNERQPKCDRILLFSSSLRSQLIFQLLSLSMYAAIFLLLSKQWRPSICPMDHALP